VPDSKLFLPVPPRQAAIARDSGGLAGDAGRLDGWRAGVKTCPRMSFLLTLECGQLIARGRVGRSEKEPMKIWCLDYRDRVFTDAAMQDVRRYSGLDLFSGAIGQFPTNSIIKLKSKRTPTDFFRAGEFWIVSLKLKGILDSRDVEAEYFPVSVINKAGEAVSGAWYCFNPTLILDWFDRSKSKFVAEHGFATHIEAIALNLTALGEVPLAVAAKTLPELVGVRDDVAESIVANGCTGVVFRDSQDWQNPVNPVT
jgi:hypothetical protein